MPEAKVDRFRVDRVVAALDGASRIDVVSAAAVDIAARCRAELASVFIEDISLFRLATMPAARHICLTSSTSERLVPEVLEAELRSRARAATAAISEAAGVRGLSCSFHTVRGMPQETLARFARQGDLLVLPSPEAIGSLPLKPFSALLRAAESAVGSALIVRGPSSYTRPLVVGKSLADVREAMAALRHLQPSRNPEIDVVVPGLPRDGILRIDSDLEGAIRLQRPVDASADALLKLVRTLGSDLLIVSDADVSPSTDYVRSILSKADTPVLLLK